jgi:hypothetical protein
MEPLTREKVLNYFLKKGIEVAEAELLVNGFEKYLNEQELNYYDCSLKVFELWCAERDIPKKKFKLAKLGVIGGLVIGLVVGSLGAVITGKLSKENKYVEGKTKTIAEVDAKVEPEITPEELEKIVKESNLKTTKTERVDFDENYISEIENIIQHSKKWTEYEIVISPELLAEFEDKGYSYISPNDAGHTVFDHNSQSLKYISTSENSIFKGFPNINSRDGKYYEENDRRKDILSIIDYDNVVYHYMPITREAAELAYGSQKWEYAGNSYEIVCKFGEDDCVYDMLLVKNGKEIIGHGEPYTVYGSGIPMTHFYHDELKVGSLWAEEIITLDNMKNSFEYFESKPYMDNRFFEAVYNIK